jgi:rare lipoprotein A (peptidoglycan hydrolase)
VVGVNVSVSPDSGIGTLFVAVLNKEVKLMDIFARRYLLLPIFVAGVFVLWLYSGIAVSAEDTASKAEVVADKVEKKAEKTEKAEGKDNLVKDEVTVKSDGKGEPVVEQKGEASWYGKGFHGKKTASGEKFDQNDHTAAHPTLPLGSKAKVTNLETGKSVEVEINDRGPYVKGRDIDLSKEAAGEIGIHKDGAAPVEIEAKVPSEEEKKTTK